MFNKLNTQKLKTSLTYYLLSNKRKRNRSNRAKVLDTIGLEGI